MILCVNISVALSLLSLSQMSAQSFNLSLGPGPGRQPPPLTDKYKHLQKLAAEASHREILIAIIIKEMFQHKAVISTALCTALYCAAQLMLLQY